MVTSCDKGSDTVRLKSGSSHMDIKEKSIWVPMCKEKREKNGSISDFHHIRSTITSIYQQTEIERPIEVRPSSQMKQDVTVSPPYD